MNLRYVSKHVFAFILLLHSICWVTSTRHPNTTTDDHQLRHRQTQSICPVQGNNYQYTEYAIFTNTLIGRFVNVVRYARIIRLTSSWINTCGRVLLSATVYSGVPRTIEIDPDSSIVSIADDVTLEASVFIGSIEIEGDIQAATNVQVNLQSSSRYGRIIQGPSSSITTDEGYISFILSKGFLVISGTVFSASTTTMQIEDDVSSGHYINITGQVFSTDSISVRAYGVMVSGNLTSYDGDITIECSHPESIINGTIRVFGLKAILLGETCSSTSICSATFLGEGGFLLAGNTILGELSSSGTQPWCDECSSNPCRNSGVCQENGPQRYTCACPEGLGGWNCEIDLSDDCLGVRCFNGGTCIDGDGSSFCECIEGYQGDDCGINIDDCAGVECLNGGTCVDGVNRFVCRCKDGFSGSFCEEKDDPRGTDCERSLFRCAEK